MLEEFYQGFNADLIEVILFVALILIFVVGLVLAYRRIVRRERAEQKARAEAFFEEGVREKGLSEAEVRTLEELSTFLNSRVKRYMLLDNQSIFNACAEAAVSSKLIPESRISALRVRLGFAGRKFDAPPDSSAHIGEGSSVLLIQEGRPSIRGQVLAPEPTFFRVKVDTPNRPFASGSRVEVLYQDSSGMYTFTTPVKGFKQSVLFLGHSESLSRVQRRQYYRRDITLPVFVKSAGKEEKPVESRFLDLGGGGASLENPGNRFKPGAGLELSFYPGTRRSLSVVGHVVRTSKRGSVLHISFEHLKESTRDNIYRLLFDEEKKRRRPQQDEGEQSNQ